MGQSIFKDWDAQPALQTRLLVCLLKAHLVREDLETVEQLYALKGRRSISFDVIAEAGFPRKALKPTPLHLRRMSLVDSYRKSAIHLTDSGILLLINNRQHWSY